MKLQLGRVSRRVCGRCDFAIEGDTDDRECPRCHEGLIEIRARPDDLIGQLVDGRYEIREELGRGGMGTVYRAWQASVQREVAIKLMAPGAGSDPMAVTRFEREAQLASRLSQPNTVSILDFGKTADGRLYIAMELIRGRHLLELIREAGALSVARVIAIGAQICDALDAAHGLGIVHRDLKLENVLVLDEPPGRDLVKVLDFGLAKRVDDQRGTAAGVVVGTPRYIAPETAIDGATTTASDMYAVGVILAELALGRPLWDGDNLGDLLHHKLQPRAVIAPVPGALRRVVAALVDPDPRDRPSAAEVRRQLAASSTTAAPAPAPAPTAAPAPATVTSHEQSTVPMRVVPPTPAPRPGRTTRGWIAVAAAVTAMALGVAVLVAVSRGSVRDPKASQLAPERVQQAVPAVPADAAGHPIVAVPAARLVDAGSETVVFHLRSRPDGADLKVGGQPVGKTPLDLPLPRSTTTLWVDGRYDQALLSHSVAPDREREIMLDYPAHLAWDADRSPPPADAVALHVRTLPAGAIVKIADNSYGPSPVEIWIARSTTSVRVLGTLDYDVESVTVVPDRERHVEVDLAPTCADELARSTSRACVARFCAGHPDDRACRPE